MVTKEGDEKGIEYLKSRIMADVEVMARARKLYGIPKIELYNSLEQDKALDYVDPYECTSECVYTHDDAGKVSISKTLWPVQDGENAYYSLLPPAVITQLVKQLATTLGYNKVV